MIDLFRALWLFYLSSVLLLIGFLFSSKKKKTKKILAVIVTVLLVFGGIMTGQYYHRKRVIERQIILSNAYFRFNDGVFVNACFRKHSYSYGLYEDQLHYHSFEDVNLNELKIGLHVFNHYSNRDLSVEDIESFMTNEFDENGNPAVLDQPWQIHEFVEFVLGEGRYYLRSYREDIETFYYNWQYDLNDEDMNLPYDFRDFDEEELEEVMRAYDECDEINIDVFE